MKPAITPTLSAVMLCLICTTASLAAQPAGSDKNKVEAVVFGGYRSGGSFDEMTTTTGTSDKIRLEEGSSYGVALNWQSEEDSVYELIYSKRSSQLGAATPVDISVEYLHIGGYVTFAESTEHVIPYFLLTVGAARFAPDNATLEAMTRASGAVGGGVKIPFASRFAVRLDARLYASFFGGQQDVFCHTHNDPTCPIHLRGGTVLQPDISLGFSVGF